MTDTQFLQESIHSARVRFNILWRNILEKNPRLSPVKDLCREMYFRGLIDGIDECSREINSALNKED